AARERRGAGAGYAGVRRARRDGALPACADRVRRRRRRMSARRIASWRALDLAGAGRSLIEASAGTGKTWTIAVLYLRLLLEGETPRTPRQIVVGTFTDAAA